jgi:CDP-paratose 2-epimerase
MRILITGGAGFVGSNLAKEFKESFPKAEVVVFDNLHRRGSEINLAAFKRLGITFVHGDIRVPSDLENMEGTFDVFIEASAEPSVHAGVGASPRYVIETNLVGTLHCLEFARKKAGKTIFLSTSRVYSIPALRSMALREAKDRFEIKLSKSAKGYGAKGIAEDFPTDQFRSIYGSTKLASELILQEYVETYGMKAVINRCGVIAGPGQFGKVDQGVFTLWVANHYFGKPLRYTGFGGKGKQVRDLLHPHDLYRLILIQLEKMDKHRGEVFNVGGGRPISVSLKEMTALCQEVTGRKVEITSDTRTAGVDIPLYLSDSSKVRKAFGWAPEKRVETIIGDIYNWIHSEEDQLKPLFS